MKTWAVIAICLAASVAGCSSTDEYVDDVNEIQGRVIDASKSVGSDVNASKKDILDSVEQAKAEAEAAVKDLQDVDVPEEAEAGHEDLIKGFEDLEKLYESMRKELESGSGGAAFDELRTEGAEIDKEIDSALTEINKDLGLE
jgi:hypothetical protein